MSNGDTTDAPAMILCVDCGEDAHLLAVRGDIASYRCAGCLDRWDVVIEPVHLPDGGGGPSHGAGPEPPGAEGELSP